MDEWNRPIPAFFEHVGYRPSLPPVDLPSLPSGGTWLMLLAGIAFALSRRRF